MQVRFVLMNSFSTSDDTKKHLSKAHKELVDETDSELMQNKSPKINADTLEPATYPEHPDMEWRVPLLLPASFFPANSTILSGSRSFAAACFALHGGRVVFVKKGMWNDEKGGMLPSSDRK